MMIKLAGFFLDEDRAEISIGEYFINCKKGQATIGKNASSGGNQIVIKDDGIHFYGNIYMGDKLVNL